MSVSLLFTPIYYAILLLNGQTEQAAVLDGASDLFAHVLGEKAGHTRTVFGHSELPMNASVELSIIAVSDGFKNENCSSWDSQMF